IAQRLRPIVIESIPLGDRLTVGQAIRLYEWRKLIDVANSAYDIWRVIRLLNPVSAATQEIRERLSKKMYEGLREELAKRLLSTYVREVGLAAIDLYSGRLAVLSAEKPLADRADLADDAAPLRILLAGKSGSGKSSLVNALAREVQAPTDVLPQTRAFAAYEVQGPGMPPVELIDSPGIATAAEADTIASKATDCDLLVWVASADRPDRLIDRAALDTFRRHFAANRDRPAPPVLVVLTNIDRLRPFAEWAPPYDIASPATPKARSIADALAAASDDLAVPASHIVPVALHPDHAAYNVDLVWAELTTLLPAAKSAQLLRRIAKTRKNVDWRRLLTQAVGAGRLATDLLTRR
ncbi:MAG: 50S ribosome-binding GTPase, partial [Proteobacteria bacterium]|nr:50S ribosome-binding GTPase [Pseudomonadota bacterium]